MAVAIDPRDTFPYVLKEDIAADEADQTTFHLHAMTEAQERKFLKLIEEPLQFATSVLSECLAGWDNLLKPDGGQYEFIPAPRGRGASQASLDLLSPAWRSELAGAVLSRGQLSEDEGN